MGIRKGQRVVVHFSDGDEFGVVMKGGKKPTVAIDGTFTEDGWQTASVDARIIEVSNEPLPKESQPPEDDPFAAAGFEGIKFSAQPHYGHDSLAYAGVVIRNGRTCGIFVEDPGMGGCPMFQHHDASDKDKAAFEAAAAAYGAYKGYGEGDKYPPDEEHWVSMWAERADNDLPANAPFAMCDVYTKEQWDERRTEPSKLKR